MDILAWLPLTKIRTTAWKNLPDIQLKHTKKVQLGIINVHLSKNIKQKYQYTYQEVVTQTISYLGHGVGIQWCDNHDICPTSQLLKVNAKLIFQEGF